MWNLSYFPVQRSVYGFTANRAETSAEDQYETINAGSIIRFSKVITNIGGAYDPTTSQFTCPVKGLYVFIITVESGDGHKTAYAALSVDGTLHLTARAQASSGVFDQGTQAVTVECSIGQKVYVEARLNMEVYDNGIRDYSNFSGWLVQVIQD